MGSGASKKEREKIKASPPLLFIAFSTSHRSPPTERLEQANLFLEKIHQKTASYAHVTQDTCPMERYIRVALTQPKPPRIWLL